MPQSRGRNYDTSEIRLAQGWDRVSTDAAKGANLTTEVFCPCVKATMEESETIAAATEADTYEPRT